ncbi:hypothetical protein KDL01_37115 [Actinospica durhamensis]|uniref:Uncharacterized protein n=1 Tax=Actinospica durhamensis TaxID=1508375 RepID=A0A941IVA8_9ACTN|nr:hypothetical protein [Actinospica durhamensis]MBR7838948.1 hypothetical protein [Actinospica durhamensis]
MIARAPEPGPGFEPSGSAQPDPAPDMFAGVCAVADAVLYEGYLLYPYRRSSAKNRMRWQFGVLVPRPWLAPSVAEDTSVAGSADAWRQQTECLLEAPVPEAAMLTVCVRFLQMQHREVQQRTGNDYVPVDALTVEDQRHLTFDEAVPQEHELVAQLSKIRDAPLRCEFKVPGAEEIEQLGDAGRVVRTRQPLRAVAKLSATPVAEAPSLLRLRLEVYNAAESPALGAPRPQALGASLIATHSLLNIDGGRFVSLLDPPEWAAAAAKACRNIHTFPVLAGAPEECETVLSSPILMEDHPRVSPESPGDLFDATEIDEILSLRTLTLTDAEKREARATDPRAAQIIDRVETLPPAVLGRLHGVIRGRGPAPASAPRAAAQRPPNEEHWAEEHWADQHWADEPCADAAAVVQNRVPAERWWEPGADEAINPATDRVLVDGVAVRRGSRVRLNPRRHGTDVHDMFLVGRTARVEAVLTDIDGSCYVAVSIEDDPGADLHGRHYHFTPEELTTLDGEPEAAR